MRSRLTLLPSLSATLLAAGLVAIGASSAFAAEMCLRQSLRLWLPVPQVP